MYIHSWQNDLFSSIEFRTDASKQKRNENTTQEEFIRKLAAFRKDLADKKRNGVTPPTEPRTRFKNEDVVQIENSGPAQLFEAWNSKLPVEDMLKELDGNLARIEKFSIDTKIDPAKIIEHLSSQYSIYKQHLEKNGTAEQRKHLDAILEKHTERYARSFSDVVGGFFENYGMKNERKWLYESVVERVSILSKSYDHYIAKNASSFEKLMDGAEQKKLCAAFVLRDAYKEAGDGEVFFRGRNGGYTRDELSGAAQLVRVAQEILNSGEAALASEEELGLQFGKIALQGMLFLENSQARGDHKDAFWEAVHSRVNDLIAQSDDLLSKKADTQQSKTPYSPLNRSAIHDVIQTIMNYYAQTKSTSEALRFAQQHALRTYSSKAVSNSSLARYQASPYFEALLRNSSHEAQKFNVRT